MSEGGAFRFAKGSLAEDGRQVVAKGFCKRRVLSPTTKKCTGAGREPAKSRVEVVDSLDEPSP